MKKIFFCILAIFLPAIGSQIVISPGDSITVSPNGMILISCQDSSVDPICENTVGTGNCNGLAIGKPCTYYSSPGLVAKPGTCVQSGFSDGKRWCSCGPR